MKSIIKINEPRHQQFLRELKLFRNLGDEELKLVKKCLTIIEVPKEGIVFERYSKEQVLYILRYGKLKLESIGNEVRVFEKGDFFGEIGLMNTNFRTGTVTALEPSLLFCLNGPDLIDESRIPSRTALKIVVELGKKITSYLITALNSSTQSLIEGGENDSVEFKSTLRYNLFTKKFDKEIEHAALKTIAAFLNSAGGTLLIGVDDKKTLLSLSADNFRNDDHMLLHLTKLIEDNLGLIQTQFVNAMIDSVENNKVLRIDVKPSSVPAYLNYKNDEIFYIRSGPSSAQLKISEIFHYLNTRFYSHIK